MTCSMSPDCMQLVGTVTLPPAVHFIHALVHHWPVAAIKLASYIIEFPLIPCDGFCRINASLLWTEDSLDRLFLESVIYILMHFHQNSSEQESSAWSFPNR